MSFIRLYSGDDGETHIEEMTLESHPSLKELQQNVGISFRESAVDSFSDWHHAPRRQYVITLQGEVEIGLGDGSVHRYGPGHVTLAEDLTGKGHTTRNIGSVTRISATIPIE